jgi:hypothetical protein
MLSSYLHFRGDGTGVWISLIEIGDGSGTFEQTSEFTYTQNGPAITISLRCPDTASCIAGPHLVGDVTANTLLIPTSNVIRTPLVFELAPAALPD